MKKGEILNMGPDDDLKAALRQLFFQPKPAPVQRDGYAICCDGRRLGGFVPLGVARRGLGTALRSYRKLFGAMIVRYMGIDRGRTFTIYEVSYYDGSKETWVTQRLWLTKL